MFTTPEEWSAAELECKEELAAAYAHGRLEVPQPVDENLNKLARKITARVIRSAHTVSN